MFSVLATSTIQGFPWPLIPGRVGFLIGFVVQFQLKNHIDRNKVLQIENMAELYPNGLPPRKILTERGQRLYLWFYVGIGLFAAHRLSLLRHPRRGEGLAGSKRDRRRPDAGLLCLDVGRVSTPRKLGSRICRMSDAVQYLTDQRGERTAVVLPISEYEKLLEDLKDLAVVAERRDDSTIPHEQFISELKRDGIL